MIFLDYWIFGSMEIHIICIYLFFSHSQKYKLNFIKQNKTKEKDNKRASSTNCFVFIPSKLRRSCTWQTNTEIWVNFFFFSKLICHYHLSWCSILLHLFWQLKDPSIKSPSEILIKFTAYSNGNKSMEIRTF